MVKTEIMDINIILKNANDLYNVCLNDFNNNFKNIYNAISFNDLKPKELKTYKINSNINENLIDDISNQSSILKQNLLSLIKYINGVLEIDKFDGLKEESYNINQSNFVSISGIKGLIQLENIIKFTDKDGNESGILNPQEYQIYDIKYDKDGNIILIKISEDEDKWIKISEIDDKTKITLYTDNKDADIKTINIKKSPKVKYQSGILGMITLLSLMTFTDKDGKESGTLNPQKYQIYDIKYDKDGNIIAVKISKDEDKWVLTTTKDKDNIEIDLIGEKGYIELSNYINIYDKDSKLIGRLDPGKYLIYNVEYDKDGNIVLIKISKDEDEWIKILEMDNKSEITLYTDNKDVDIKKINIEKSSKVKYQSGILGMITLLSLMTFTDKDGKESGTLNPQKYQIYDIKYDKDGNIIAVKISKDEDKWVLTTTKDKDNIEIDLIGEKGYIELSNYINIYDKDSKLIGRLDPGKYLIYNVEYDKDGNIVLIKISKDEDKWIKLIEIDDKMEIVIPKIMDKEILSKEEDSLSMIINEDKISNLNENYDNDKNNIENSNNKVIHIERYNNNVKGIIKLFDDKDIIIGGIIGLILIAAASRIYIKNKKGKKVSKLESGQYNIYDINKDNDGNITKVRISPIDDEEYWIDM